MRDMNPLRFSLVFVWLATASASVWELHGQSAALLSQAGIRDVAIVRTLVVGGAVVDAVLGLALWLKPSRRVYLLALAVMCVMTLVVTLLDPSLWLHPLGPLTKNAPIAVALWMLAQRQAKSADSA
jgi:hypothetical protein